MAVMRQTQPDNLNTTSLILILDQHMATTTFSNSYMYLVPR